MNLEKELNGTDHAVISTETGPIEVWVMSYDGEWTIQAGVRNGNFLEGLRGNDEHQIVRDTDRNYALKRMECILEAYLPELKDSSRPRSAWERLGEFL